MENSSSVPFYLEKIRDVYFDKQKTNSAFSLRSYARFLGIQPPSLSSILRNKRRLPVKLADQVMDKLNLSPIEKRRFRDSLFEHMGNQGKPKIKSNPLSSHILKAEENHKIIAEWEHYAVLILLGTRRGKSDPAWISERLGITPLRVQDVLQRLLSAGLLRRMSSGRLIPTHESVSTTEDECSSALRKAHVDGLHRAQTAIETVPVELRDFSSITLAMDLGTLNEAKQLIRSFRKQMAALVERSTSEEVYELAIQFFPVTKIEGY